MTSPPRCLITGATGFVGSHLARKLVSDGWQVHILVRTSSSLSAIADIAERLTIHTLTPPNTPTTESVAAAVAAAKPDVVFHLAAMFRAEHQPADIAPMVEANVIFTTQLLEGMRLAGVSTLVNTGTSWQHYRGGNDGQTYDPVCLYAATKQAAEDIITFYCNAHGMKAVTLKLYDTYGPGDTRNKLLNIFKRASERSIETAAAPIAFSPGEQMIDLVHIDDVVRAYLVAAHEAAAAPIGSNAKYGVSSGEPLPLRELAAQYAKVAGRPLNITWGERAYRAREVMHTPQLPALPNWAPTISLADGLAKMAADAATSE
jgi:nucleoside-diphosphate-sugar epimerase